jgi:hypothetical protein
MVALQVALQVVCLLPKLVARPTNYFLDKADANGKKEVRVVMRAKGLPIL